MLKQVDMKVELLCMELLMLVVLVLLLVWELGLGPASEVEEQNVYLM